MSRSLNPVPLPGPAVLPGIASLVFILVLLASTHARAQVIAVHVSNCASIRDHVEIATGSLADVVCQSLSQYRNGQLHKNLTTLVLGLESEYRAQSILYRYESFLDAEQNLLAYQIIDNYDRRFDELFRCRIEILEKRRTPKSIPRLLKYNDIAIFILTNLAASEIYENVLNDSQRNQLATMKVEEGAGVVRVAPAVAENANGTTSRQ